MSTLFFAKTNSDATIPSKKPEDAGYDFYCSFPEEEIIIKPHTICLVPTGIATAFSSDYVLFMKERSSTGMRGFSLRMGVVDSGYRGEIKVGINNTTEKTLIISKKVNEINETETTILYPYTKAIAQGVLLKIPSLESKEITYEELKLINSERGEGGFGSSKK